MKGTLSFAINSRQTYYTLPTCVRECFLYLLRVPHSVSNYIISLKRLCLVLMYQLELSKQHRYSLISVVQIRICEIQRIHIDLDPILCVINYTSIHSYNQMIKRACMILCLHTMHVYRMLYISRTMYLSVIGSLY